MQTDKPQCNHFPHACTQPGLRSVHCDLHRKQPYALSPGNDLQYAGTVQGCACGAESPSSGYIEEFISRKNMWPSHGDKPASKPISGELRKKDHMSPDRAKSVSDDSCSAASLSHWWEAPPGAGSQGRSVTCTFPLQQPASSSSFKSDVTFEGGAARNASLDDCSESTPIGSSSTHPRAHVCDAERMWDYSNEASPDTTASSQVDNSQALEIIDGAAGESQSPYESNNKEKTNRWSEDGKTVIKSDVFAAVLPSADEVGLQWRISELRVALRASESARLESERETHALRKYLAEVEAAAANLQLQVQDLEHLIAFSSTDQTRNLDQLRAKLAVEASKEARNQASTAAQAVAAAREATMELDKVKRHASALIKAQEEEIVRLSLEAAECRTLYHARSGQLQAMKDQIENLEQNIKHQSKSAEDALLTSREEVMDVQKKFEAAKLAEVEKASQYADLLEAYEFAKEAAKTAESRLEEVEREKKELLSFKELLEQRILDLQNRDSIATEVHYDHELRKVRALLEGEKHHLLTDLAMLRRGNQTLQGELVEWQEKFDALSRHVSGLESMSSAHKPTSLGSEVKMQPGMTPNISFGNMSEVEAGSRSHQEDLSQCKLCTRSMTSEKETVNGTGGLPEGQVDSQSVAPMSAKCNSRVLYKINMNEGKHESSESFDGNSSMHEGNLVHVMDNRNAGKHETNISSPAEDCDSCQKTSCLFLRDDLLSAAHREIVKLKEINQCLVAACQNDFRLTKDWKTEQGRKNGCLDE